MAAIPALLSVKDQATLDSLETQPLMTCPILSECSKESGPVRNHSPFTDPSALWTLIAPTSTHVAMKNARKLIDPSSMATELLGTGARPRGADGRLADGWTVSSRLDSSWAHRPEHQRVHIL